MDHGICQINGPIINGQIMVYAKSMNQSMDHDICHINAKPIKWTMLLHTK